MDCSIIGFGNFSKASSFYLKDYFDVYVYDIRIGNDLPDYVKQVELSEALSKDIILLSIPVQFIESFLSENAVHIKPGSILVDICSVKMKPVALMKKYLSEGVEYIGTHPLFGPQSIRNGLADHKIVLSKELSFMPVYEAVKKFLSDTLKLNVIEMTSEEHDKEMSVVQALNHFITKGLRKIGLKESEVSTPAYKRLYDLYETLRYDSDELFYTIQRENPFADDIRKKFIETLNEIENDILNEPSAKIPF